MALLPESGQMDRIEAHCLALMDAGEVLGPVEIADRLMSLPDLPMHFPYHHFLVPAALLTAACMCTKGEKTTLARHLKTARERAGILPGGMCGQFGCCGSALGSGIFAAVWMGTTPLSKKEWAVANAFTAHCLTEVSSVDGPRCCKRVTYLSLSAAISAARQLLELDLGEVPDIRCHHHEKNRECRKAACPFFPTDQSKEDGSC